MKIETIRKRWRNWLRILHRDAGYLAVGLTFIYAFSGIAINHLGSWDPNFKRVVKTSYLDGPYPQEKAALTARIVSGLAISPDKVQASFYDSDTVFELSLADGSARLDIESGTLTVVGRSPRFFLRVANWLHYNRGKATWTYIADGYAVLLIYLAISGAFMLKGRKGLIGRGAILILIGAAVPFIYIQFITGI